MLFAARLIPLLPFIAIAFSAASPARAQNDLDQATVTRVERNVRYGEIKKGRTAARQAKGGDIVRQDSFLLTETESRAELKYLDGAIVRIGQNTVFSFDADTRTLNLDKGTFVFYVPKGTRATIKTPSLTAAITGTTGKVSENIIAILDGEVVLQPSGRRVSAGQFARRNADGSITIAPFDPASALGGKLMTFNGRLPGFDERLFQPASKLTMPNLSIFDTLERTQNNPSAIRTFNPQPSATGQEREEQPPEEQVTQPGKPKPPTGAPPPPPPPGGGGGKE